MGKGLPKHIIKKYGVTKKAWQVYKSGKSKSKGSSNPRTKMTAKTSKKRATANIGMKIYRKTEKAIGVSRIVERLFNVVGFPPEPWRSLVTTGVGFARGGVPGGLGAAVVSSNLLEMAMNRFGGAGSALAGRNGDVDGL